jgi:hypothetical protein
MLAAIRPDDWNLPLLVHVAGAMLLVGAIVVATVVMATASRAGAGAAELSRVAFRALLLGALPAYVVMRVGAEWLASREDVADPGWIGIGYAVADGGLLLTIVATVLAARARRRSNGAGGRAVVVLGAVLLAAYAVAIWAMTSKPG